jgi:hypothetical protein
MCPEYLQRKRQCYSSLPSQIATFTAIQLIAVDCAIGLSCVLNHLGCCTQQVFAAASRSGKWLASQKVCTIAVVSEPMFQCHTAALNRTK